MIGNSKRETCYPLTFGHRPIYICGEAATFTPHSSFLIWVELSSQIKEQHVPGANPEPRTIKNSKNLLTQ